MGSVPSSSVGWGYRCRKCLARKEKLQWLLNTSLKSFFLKCKALFCIFFILQFFISPTYIHAAHHMYTYVLRVSVSRDVYPQVNTEAVLHDV